MPVAPSALPLYLIDASAWSHYGSSMLVTERIDEIARGGLIMTCPPASLEYCFMARNKAEHDIFRARMSRFKQAERHPETADVLSVQSALWGCGLVGAAGSMDTLIAAYALLNNAVVVSCDKDFGYLSTALDGRLLQIRLKP